MRRHDKVAIEKIATDAIIAGGVGIENTLKTHVRYENLRLIKSSLND